MDDLRKKSVLQTDFMGGGGVGNSWGKIYLSCRLMLENNVEGFYLARFGKNPYPNQITHTLPPPPTPPSSKVKWSAPKYSFCYVSRLASLTISFS